MPFSVAACIKLWCSWWRHQMETFSALLAICMGNSPVTGEFPSQKPVTRSFDVFFDLHLNKQLSKQSWRRWFETPSCSLWHHCNVHDDVTKWKHFPRNWPFVREIHRSPVNFPHKGQWRGALMFSLIYAWINDWVNNREAGDLRRQHGHYDVIVMGVAVNGHYVDTRVINLFRSLVWATIREVWLHHCSS